jgi:ActR/RegA family two-component response regulator
MQELLREMIGGQARIADAEQEPLVDRAWAAICEALGSFSGRRQGFSQPTPFRAGNPPARAAHAAAVQHEQSQQSASRTLLLVDDEVNIQRALMRLLRTEGYRILCASSAAEAMEIIDQNDIQVIVSDQRMPSVSGTEFLNNVKAIRPNTIRILLSGYSDAVAVTDAINRGAIYKFLVKPWDDNDIRLQIREGFRASELH